MAASISMRQLMDWWHYYRMEPWGYEDANWRTGAICATLTNASGRVVKEPVCPSDFYPVSASEVSVDKTLDVEPASLEELMKKRPRC